LEHPAPVKVFGCEPFNYPTYARFGHERSRTIADGLMLEVPHAKVAQRIDALGIPVRLIPEAEIRAALADLYAKQALAGGPSSAIAVAWVKAHEEELEEPVCVILTGGNIARDDFDRLIAADAAPESVGGRP